MQKLRLRTDGDPVLRKKARTVDRVTPRVREVIEQMWEIMYDTNGIGLAAPQVGLSQRIIVVDTREPGEKLALVNPEIYWSSPKTGVMNEGCLSVPGAEGEVSRSLAVRVRGLSPQGREVDLEAKDLFARVFQHEIDHLMGVLFIDYLNEPEQPGS